MEIISVIVAVACGAIFYWSARGKGKKRWNRHDRRRDKYNRLAHH
jgi:hypothetical protein